MLRGEAVDKALDVAILRYMIVLVDENNARLRKSIYRLQNAIALQGQYSELFPWGHEHFEELQVLEKELNAGEEAWRWLKALLSTCLSCTTNLKDHEQKNENEVGHE